MIFSVQKFRKNGEYFSGKRDVVHTVLKIEKKTFFGETAANLLANNKVVNQIFLSSDHF